MKEDSTTQKVITLIRFGLFNKRSLSDELGITRPTMDTRMSGKSLWKKLEIKWIDYLFNENIVK